MIEDILDKSEFEAADDSIAFKKEEITHHKIIPIILRPEVTFPFHVTHLEIKDAAWKAALVKAHQEKTVVGLMYRDEETEDLPVLGRVATSAVVDTIHKAVNGSYFVKLVPINRFFTNEYVETEPVLKAEVSYYADRPEEDAVLIPVLEKFATLLHRMGKITRSESFQQMTVERLREDIQLYSFILFRNNPKLTRHDELIALWLQQASLRVTWLIDLMENSLNPNVERIGDVVHHAKNN